ncbi:glycosyltransferase [Luteimonas composti]|uniref:Glycosyltransferase n=1 Tax=Luteimonas composti TaxID=398257 RepID=A0ABT6MVF5_9GAMM|nr:glycosyltransferase [Luteimonas composti]MDH7454063.1 glycosyltransferase [Luteimonas composti]
MKVLLLAYEFPPAPSPQSLRWARLTRELVGHGFEVDVLSVVRGEEPRPLPVPAGVRVYRSPGGAATGFFSILRRAPLALCQGQELAMPVPDASGQLALGEGGLASLEPLVNWKGRLAGRVLTRLDRLAGNFTFPDAEGQWELPARSRLRELLAQLQPDIVISSHEPATTLRLGRLAKEAGYPWLVDMGDPVLSFYTPARWRRLAGRIESWTCRNADHVLVTTEAARTLLRSRYPLADSRVSVLSQGFDPPGNASGEVELPVAFDPALLELVYTGSFYAFRNGMPVVEAVASLPGARLTVATRTPPQWLLEAAARHPQALRLAGFVTQAQAAAMQRAADVLVNVANSDPVHIPGKFYEYLGAGRPILHLGDAQGDSAAELLQAQRRGLTVPNQQAAIAAALESLLQCKREGGLSRSFELDPEAVEQHSWRSLGAKLARVLEGLHRGQAG